MAEELSGRRIVVPETRELGQLVRMLEERGAEAVRKMEVENFPAIVAQDAHGGNLYVEGVKKYKKD